MATRINTRFLLILFIAVMCAGGLIGGLWFLQIRGDAGRSVEAGDALVADGNLRDARKYYGRAVRKEPGRRDWLQKLERAILDDVPATFDEARELYQLHLQVLRHEATHFPREAASHLRTLHEVHDAARLSGSVSFWQLLSTSADDMWNRADPADPQRDEARLYRGLAGVRRADVLTRAELDTAEQDLQIYVDGHLDSDLGWASLASARAALVFKLEAEGVSADEQIEQVEAIMRQARQAVPEGAHVALAELSWLVRRRRADSESVPIERLRDALDRAVELAAACDDPRLVESTATTAQQLYDIGGLVEAEALLRHDLEKNPADHKNRLILAETQSYLADLDAAYATAGELLDAPQVSVSMMSQAQFRLRPIAAALRVGVDYLRWGQADDEDKPAVLAQMQQDRDVLAALASDATTDVLLKKSDAQLAFASGDVRTAALRSEEFLETTDRVDVEMLALSARCQERLGQIGLAHERYVAAAEAQRGNVGLLVQKARLEVRMGLVSEAERTIETIRSVDAERPELAGLEQALARVDRDTSEGAPEDAVTQSLVDAQRAFDRGDVEASRGILLGALETSPDDPGLMEVLAKLEFSTGNREEARRLVDRLLERYPDQPRYVGMKLSLDSEDPVEAVSSYLQSTSDDEAELVVSKVVSFAALVEAQERLAVGHEEQGRTEAAATARSIAARALTEEQAAIRRALEIAPSDPQFLSFRFNRAMTDENWSEAEEVMELARRANIDQVDGRMLRAQYEITRGNFAEAARVLEEVTDRLAYSSAGWKWLAYCYEQLGRTADALAAYEESYRRNPNDAQTLREYVPLLVRTGQKARALDVLRPAARLAVANRQIRNIWLGLESEVGDRTFALKTRQELFMRDPDDLGNALSLAAFLAETEPTAALLLDDAGEPLFSSVRWERMDPDRQQVLLDEARRLWQEQAASIIDRLAADRAGGEDLTLVHMRARILRARGTIEGNEQGERVLRDFIEGHDASERTADMYITLSAYLRQVGKRGEALAALEQGLPYQDPVRRTVDGGLGNLYFELGDYRSCIEHLQPLAEATGDRDAALRIVECRARLGALDEAERDLQQVIDESGRDYVTWMLAAAIADTRSDRLREAGQTIGADERRLERDEALNRAERLDPTRTETYVARARAALKDYRQSGQDSVLEQALLTLDRADQVRPGDLSTSLARADVFLARGDGRGAVGELSRALERVPDNSIVRERLVRLLAASGDVDSAIEIATEGAGLSPGSSVWPEMLGDLYTTVKRDAERAVEQYRRAYALNSNGRLLAKLVNVELARETPDHGLARRELEARADLVEQSAVLQTLYAHVLYAMGVHDEAMESMRRAYATDRRASEANASDPANLATWYRVLSLMFDASHTQDAEQFVMDVTGGAPDFHDRRRLAEFWVRGGAEGVSRADEMLTLAIESCPADRGDLLAEMWNEMAQLRMIASDYAGAADAYLQVVQIDPDDASARNNLAFLTAEYLDDPDRALPYAERAVELEPENASFLDTLGWIQFKTGDVDRARRALLRSLDAQATAEAYLHLAQVQMQAGETDRAEQSLQRASELPMDGQTKAEIDRLLDDMRTGRGAGQ